VSPRDRATAPALAARTVSRRALLQGVVTLGLAPAAAQAAWRLVLAGAQSGARGLDGSQTALVAAIAEFLLPRTDTPGALDVGVVRWIDTIVDGYLDDPRREELVGTLAEIERRGRAAQAAATDWLGTPTLGSLVAELDASCGRERPSPVERGYGLLKELVVVGYFTSEPVQRDVLAVAVVPGRWDADVPLRREAPP